MRRRLVVPAVCTVAVAVAAPAFARGDTAPDPCKLVTRADATAVLGAGVAPGKLQRLGLYESCTYSAPRNAILTVQTRSISKSDFVKSAKANPGPVKPVGGIGALAYSAAGGAALLVWRNGSEATFSIFGGGPGLSREVKLAKRVVKRL